MPDIVFADGDQDYIEKLNDIAVASEAATEAAGDAVAAVATAVRFEAQTLTDEQRAQAKDNIGITFVSPMDHGAVGNGVADDTTAVQAAMDAALAAGLPVHFPGGTYLVSGLTFGIGAELIGSGVGKTIIKLADESDADVLVADDAYSLFGGSSSAGTNKWRIQAMTIDGNSANQTPADTDACNGIAFYGTKFVLRDVVIKNVAGHGIRSEWYTYGETTGGIESLLSNVTIDGAGRHGWWNNGPHDIHAEAVIVIDASSETDDTWCGIYASTKSNGRYFNTHVWHRAATTNRVQYGFSSNGANELVACHFEGGRKQLQHRSNGDRVVGCNLFAHYGAAGTALVSFEGNENIHSACRYSGTNGTSMYALEFKSSSSGNIVVGAYFNGFDISSPLLFTADGGGNRISGIGYCASGGSTAFGGTKAATTQVDYDQGGTAIVSRPTALVPAGSLAAPGLAIVGDTNTGIAQTAGADTLNFIVGGASVAGADSTGVTFTLIPKAPTAAPGTNTDQIATMAALQAAITALGLGTLATQNGTFSGTHSGTSSGTNTGDQTTITGNAGTASALQTARNINGVAFDGTGNITVTAAAGTLTGATLAAGVTASSLTSLGTLTSLTTSGQITSSVSTGTAPFVVASTTNVANLNASSLNGATFAAPGTIGGGTAASATFTNLTATGQVSFGGTAGTESLRATVVASCINFLQVQGGTAGNGPIVFPGGTENNVTLILSSRGTNGINLRTNGGFGSIDQVLVTHTASATRQLTLTGSNGGNPTIGASAGNVAVSTGLAVSGVLSIGNTVNSVSPTSPNRTVTISIGGTTYYLAAKTTND